MDIKQRKIEHIKICLEKEVEYKHNFWDDIILEHCALPNINLEKIDLSCEMLGKKLNAPFLIGAISGGIKKAKELNETLSKIASEFKIGLCLGSQRPLLKHKEDKEVRESYEIVKNYKIPLVIGNIGAPQLLTLSSKEIELLFESIGADYLAVHLNFPQEVIQPEGDTNAEGILERIKELAFSYPIIVKEVGFGISKEVLLKLKDAGVKGVDVAGTSGTNWISVEYYRAKEKNLKIKEEIAKTFWDWGIPAPLCLLENKGIGIPLIASSGIRNGLDIAKAIVLGAEGVSMARELLKEALEGEKKLKEKLSRIFEELKIAMFLTNSKEVKDLRRVKFWITGKLKDFVINL